MFNIIVINSLFFYFIGIRKNLILIDLIDYKSILIKFVLGKRKW